MQFMKIISYTYAGIGLDCEWYGAFGPLIGFLNGAFQNSMGLQAHDTAHFVFHNINFAHDINRGKKNSKDDEQLWSIDCKPNILHNLMCLSFGKT